MSDQDTTTTEAAPEDVQGATPDTDTATEPDGLGDPGKKALDAERKARREAEKQLREMRDRIAQMEETQNKTAEERAQIEQQRAFEREALVKANLRIVKAEVRAAAAGELADPADALRFIDLDDFEVDDEGGVDTDAIRGAVADLVKTKPYLAARREPRIEGSADGGAREASRPRQLTQDDVRRMKPEQVDQALRDGQLADLLSGKT